MKIYGLNSILLVNNGNLCNKKPSSGLNNNQSVQHAAATVPFAYRDYNISFTGRTPEDFYSQDFNRNNMPRTMRDYLDYDYINRQHIPPEQMMKEVFKYIEIADNFSDVKSIYSNEDLFKNLHENKVNSRKGILSEIKVARELSDVPLLNDGSDDFGMYLLKKIYLEGKTLKEINKDFLENDINDEYKGFITEPVQYSTLEAYGISYPKSAFWHSFINTRDEYKKFFVSLPKNDVIPGVNAGNHGTRTSSVSGSSSDETAEKPRKRRFSMKPHKKREIQKEIIDKKVTDVEGVKKAVVKRFGKDDPEASFIVRYMSPIMTVAADRAHLSEELKAFAEYEKANGKSGDERTMFARFWKHNPKMLEVFSAAVTDSMDMFEDIYGDGGMIPINTDLEAIKPDSDKKKTIDYVGPEFLELLAYTQDIEPLRSKKYELHDELQKQWDAHFHERYGDPSAPNEESVSDVVIPSKEDDLQSLEERLRLEAERNNAKVYKIKNANGDTVYVTSNLDEVLNDEIKNYAKYLPTRYAAKYIKATKSQNFSEDFKLSLAARKVIQEFNTQTPDISYDISEFDNGMILFGDEYDKEYYKILKYHAENYKNERAARFAILDTMLASRDINISDPRLCDIPAYNINESIVDGGNDEIQEYRAAMRNSKNIIDRKYDYYISPPTNSELNKLEATMMNMLAKYDPNMSILPDPTSVELITMLKEILPYNANKEVYKLYMSYILKEHPYSKTLLLKGDSDDMKQAKFEIIMDDLLHILVASMKKMPNIVTIFNDEVYKKHKDNLSSDVKGVIDNSIRQLNFEGVTTFYSPKFAAAPYNQSILKFKPEE